MWGSGFHGMMGYGTGWGSTGWMPFGGIFWLILLGLGIAAVVWIARAPWRGDRPSAPADRGSPGLDILEERYARGEVNRDEYLRKKRDMLGRGT